MMEERAGRLNGRSAQKRLLKEIESSLQHRFVWIHHQKRSFFFHLEYSSYSCIQRAHTCVVQTAMKFKLPNITFSRCRQIAAWRFKETSDWITHWGGWVGSEWKAEIEKMKNEISDGSFFVCSRQADLIWNTKHNTRNNKCALIKCDFKCSNSDHDKKEKEKRDTKKNSHTNWNAISGLGHEGSTLCSVESLMNNYNNLFIHPR